jgi:hypothetical protein
MSEHFLLSTPVNHSAVPDGEVAAQKATNQSAPSADEQTQSDAGARTPISTAGSSQRSSHNRSNRRPHRHVGGVAMLQLHLLNLLPLVDRFRRNENCARPIQLTYAKQPVISCLLKQASVVDKEAPVPDRDGRAWRKVLHRLPVSVLGRSTWDQEDQHQSSNDSWMSHVTAC